jgi:hypothetical protein
MSGEQAVIVDFLYDQPDLDDMIALLDRLETAVAAAGTGYVDGNEIALDDTDGRFFLYGPDADMLFASVRPVLVAATEVTVTRINIRSGRPSEAAEQQSFTLTLH